MNKVAIIGGTTAVFVVAAVAMAASPLPSASPGASPMASPMASNSPTPTKAPTPSASPTPTTPPSSSAGSAAASSAQQKTWTSDVNPVDIQGTATLTQNADGTGTLVLQLTGMVNEQNWTVDVEPGAISIRITRTRSPSSKARTSRKSRPTRSRFNSPRARWTTSSMLSMRTRVA